jgi:2-octaprenyl-6-methoxyphenol hydroxylase
MVERMADRCDAIVVGAGPAGLAAACLLAQGSVKAALIAESAASNPPDPRTVALMMPSLRLLTELRLWPGTIAQKAAPLRKLRLVDDTGSPFPAPELTFSSEEIGEEAFGWNIPLASLKSSLAEKAEALGVTMHPGHAAGVVLDNNSAEVKLTGGGTLAASVVVAADGRLSNIRRTAAIGASEWNYGQVALALSFGHSAPHRDISTEYHKEAGPFTTVPLPGRRSSLVWMVEPHRAKTLMALDDKALGAEIQIANHGELGLIEDVGPRGAFPMRGLRTSIFARNRVMLVGEAGHVVPPIGAQGLNLSFRDAATAAELISHAVRQGEDPGDPAVLSAYDNRRRADILPRQSIVDLMNRSLISHFLPLEAGRALGLAALSGFGPLRRYVMEHGTGLSGDLAMTMR